MKTHHKAILQAFANRFGYRIERLRPVTEDPYADQKMLLEKNAIDAKVVFDLGAHIGTTSTRYRQIFPSATIHAFEPFPESFQALQKLTETDPLLKAHNLAVSETSSIEEFHSYSHEQTNSLLRAGITAGISYDASYFESRAVLEVQTTTLEDFCRNQNVERIDVLKMDIQGAELMALKGARGMLAAEKIGLIYAETEFTRLYERQALFHEICGYLATFDYQLYNLYNLYRGFNGQLVAGDAIFIHRKFTA